MVIFCLILLGSVFKIDHWSIFKRDPSSIKQTDRFSSESPAESSRIVRVSKTCCLSICCSTIIGSFSDSYVANCTRFVAEMGHCQFSVVVFFPKRWQSGCIKVNPGTAARVRVSRCGSMWRGGGRRAAGSAGWPEISPISVAQYHLSTTSISTGLPRAERCMIDFQSISERK